MARTSKTTAHKLIKQRWLGYSCDEALAEVAKIEKTGGIAWLSEDRDGRGEWYGFRLHYITFASLRRHVAAAEARKAVA